MTTGTIVFPQAVGNVPGAVIKPPGLYKHVAIGSTVEVRVDRSDPNHVELVGDQDDGEGGLIGAVVLAFVFGLLTYELGGHRSRIRNRRRRTAGPRAVNGAVI